MRDWYARIVLFLIRPALERHGTGVAAVAISPSIGAGTVVSGPSSGADGGRDVMRAAVMAHVEAQQQLLAQRLKQLGANR